MSLKIKDRQKLIEEVKKTAEMPSMQLCHYPSSNCPSFASTMTLQEALEGTINKKSIDILKIQYSSTTIDM